jgi:hypothetical protein
MERASSPSKPVIRVRWNVKTDNEEHMLTFDDDDWGRNEASKFKHYLLQTGCTNIRTAREHQSWAQG